MDFQKNTQSEIQNGSGSISDRQMSEVPMPPQAAQQETGLTDQPSDSVTPTGNDQPQSSNSGSYNRNPYHHNPYENGSQYQNGSPAQNQQPYGSPGSGNSPYQVRPPYGNEGRTPYQNHNPYQNGNPYRNNNPYQNNTPYGNNGYYDRTAYQVPYAEPGSNLAGAAMILGIISIISSFTFTVYPAFILGSISIMLGLLSKGTRAKLLSKARTGVICAAISLIINMALVTSGTVLLFTNSEVREEVNRTFEQQYGMSFDEMLEEIMENSGF